MRLTQVGFDDTGDRLKRTAMDAAELEKYEYQLSQIKLALAKDPTNSEYLNLKEELTSLIELTKEYLESTQTDTVPAASTSGTSKSTSAASTSTQRPPSSSSSKQSTPSTSTPTHSLKAGDDCQARFSGDSKFYPARITSVGGADTNRVYSIVFKGYDSTELVSHNDIKPLTDNKKRMIEVEEEEKEKERKRKKNEKKADTKEVKNKEQGDRQKTWQSFTKKSAKKGIGEINQTIPPLFERVLTFSSSWLVVVIPGVTGASLFRSPADLNPSARVGVVGSGQGMKPNAIIKRQTFREGDQE